MIVFIALVISIMCVYNFGTEVNKYVEADLSNNEVKKTASADEFNGEIDFEKLWKINPDVVGQIYQNKTSINYPVVKCDNSPRYLNENLQGQYSIMGTLFIDANNKDNLEDFNTIIYGHHMKDLKQSRFGSFKNYFYKSGYYEKHRQFEYITLNEKYHLKIIAAYTAPAGGDAYQYELEDRKVFIDNAVKKSQIQATCSANPDDTRHLQEEKSQKVNINVAEHFSAACIEPVKKYQVSRVMRFRLNLWHQFFYPHPGVSDV